MDFLYKILKVNKLISQTRHANGNASEDIP